jgi:hypothetical protein
MLGYTREQLSDSVPNFVPLAIITSLTILFVAYNPWGWSDWFLIVEIFGLHLVPIITLAPITYVFVKLISESSDGKSETANRIKSWFAMENDLDEELEGQNDEQATTTD